MGSNLEGQLGAVRIGANILSISPAPLQASSEIAIAAGQDHTLVLREC